MKKRRIISMLVVLAVALSACGSRNSGSGARSQPSPQSHFYSDAEARQAIESNGYQIADDLSSNSQDGFYSCTVSVQPEEYRFLSVSGKIDLRASYSESGGIWNVSISPHIDYDWHVSGNWYADTECYDVYINFLEFSRSQMHIILEARYEGGNGTYGEKEQTRDLSFCGDMQNQTDGYLECSVTGGYPEFNMRIYKDTMIIWQLYDSYQAEFIAIN